MEKKGVRALLITVGGGLVVFLLLAAFLGGLRRTEPVVVAAAPLPAGARLTADYLEVREIHASAVLPNALSTIEEAEGQVLTIARATGDQVTADMLGDQATVGVATQLEPGHRAVAVHVNRASGLVGALRPGDRVAVVAIVDPQTAGVGQTGAMPLFSEEAALGGLEGDGEEQPEVRYPPSPAAYVVVSGLRVLLVPQTFRYEETLPDEEGGAFSLARTTAAAQQEGVILLDAPVYPVEIADGVEASPAALLPLLDAYAHLHLLLEPADDDGVTISVGAELGDLYRAIVGWEKPAVAEAEGNEVGATARITDTGGE